MKRKILAIILVICLTALIVYAMLPGGYLDDQVKKRDSLVYCDAVEKTDSSVCGTIWTGDIRSGCYYYFVSFYGDIKLCDNMNPHENEDCRLTAATASGNISQCEEMKDDTKLSCYSNVAGRLNDKTICDKILDPKINKDCHKNIENASPVNETPQDFIKDYCKNVTETTTIIPF